MRRFFDRVLNTMIEYGARSERVPHFGAWLDRETGLEQEDRDALQATYKTADCRGLRHRRGRRLVLRGLIRLNRGASRQPSMKNRTRARPVFLVDR